MRFLNDSTPPYELTYHDVFMVPSRSSVGSRGNVDITTIDGSGTTIPLVVSNMTAVSGRRMAETVARRGGIAILPQDVPTDIAAETIRIVKASHPVFDTPITVKPHHTVGYTKNLIHKRAHGAAIVVDEEGRPIGLVTDKDLANRDNFTQVQAIMSTELMTIPDSVEPKEAFTLLAEASRKVAPVIDGEGALVGVLTRKSALRATLYSSPRRCRCGDQRRSRRSRHRTCGARREPRGGGYRPRPPGFRHQRGRKGPRSTS